MEVDKLKKWLDVAQQFQSEKFWNQIFDEKNQSRSSNITLNPLAGMNDFFPKCDLYELDQWLIVEAEIPGLAREDLHISIHQQMLTIMGEFKALEQNRKYFLKERINRKFKKELTLPYPVILQQVKSEIRNGVLYIIMPYNQEDVEDIPIAFDQSTSE